MKSRIERLRALEATLLDSGLAARIRIGSTIHGSTARTESDPSPLEPLLRRLDGSRGQLIEIAGGPSSGRTALACRMAADRTARGDPVGWVDLPDALDPRSLRRAGVALHSLLWARPLGVIEALRSAELMLRTGLILVVLDLQGIPPSRLARHSVPVWMRLLRAARGARATALVLSTERLAGTFPTLGLWTERRGALFEKGLFEGVEIGAIVVRDRAGPTGGEHPFQILLRPHGPPPGR